jgi:hypothetical protein
MARQGHEESRRSARFVELEGAGGSCTLADQDGHVDRVKDA